MSNFFSKLWRSIAAFVDSLTDYAYKLTSDLGERRFFVLLGPPGAGKGTLGSELALSLNLPTISIGDLFRREVALGSPVGLQLEALMKTGNLADDDLTLSVLNKELTNPKYIRGAIFDGFPRNTTQAEQLDLMLEELDSEIQRAIFLDVPENELKDRLAGRLTCLNKDCGRTFHLRLSPPKNAGTCDHCGSSLHQRADDAESVVESRLDTYRRRTAPLVDYYSDLELLLSVDASNEVGKKEVLKFVLNNL